VNPDIILIVVIVVLLAVSALMALAETAFVRISRIRLMNLAEEGDKRAERLLRLLEHPEKTLNSVLLVLLACQMISATLLGTLLIRQPALSDMWLPTIGGGAQLFGVGAGSASEAQRGAAGGAKSRSSREISKVSRQLSPDSFA
jgi:CBS domain containing-hemolysin-like protein